jgi:hypothetical protein
VPACMCVCMFFPIWKAWELLDGSFFFFPSLKL